MIRTLLLCSMLAQSPPSSPLAADIVVSDSAALRTALASAKPGARIVLAPGEYTSLAATNVQGSAERPIILGALDPRTPPVFRGGVMFSDVAYLEIGQLVILGAPANGLNIDDGGTFDTPSHHVVLRDIVVRDCGGRENHDAIKLSGVDDFRLERCTLERWGRGGSAVDMVGCHRGVLEGCTIRDLEQGAASSGVQAKGGSSDIRILNSRFEHAGERAVNLGGSTGLAYFRPKPEGFEARNISVEGCTFEGSLSPIAFVGVDGASVRWNTFYRPRKWVARILQETREPGFAPCRKGVFSDNLIVYRASEVATAVNVGPDTAPKSFAFARNYWYCLDEPARGSPALPVVEKQPAGGQDPLLVDVETGNFTLAPDSPARLQGAGAWPAERR